MAPDTDIANTCATRDCYGDASRFGYIPQAIGALERCYPHKSIDDSCSPRQNGNADFNYILQAQLICRRAGSTHLPINTFRNMGSLVSALRHVPASAFNQGKPQERRRHMECIGPFPIHRDPITIIGHV